MILLLDLGNSRLKWAFADADLGEGGNLGWQRPALLDDLLEHWRQRPTPQAVLAASVTTSERRACIDGVLAELGWPQADWLQSPHRHGTLTSAYDQPADLGIDRFLAMLAAFDAGLTPCVMASCGTALTLDALAANGRHLGGQIIPGVGSMLLALRQQAPGLPDPRTGQCVAFAKSTDDAMQSGARHALAGAVEHFLALAEAQMTNKPRLLLCGGHAEQISKLLLNCDARQFPQAVLQGLLVWSNQR